MNLNVIDKFMRQPEAKKWIEQYFIQLGKVMRQHIDENGMLRPTFTSEMVKNCILVAIDKPFEKYKDYCKKPFGKILFKTFVNDINKRMYNMTISFILKVFPKVFSTHHRTTDTGYFPQVVFLNGINAAIRQIEENLQ